ncbi:MAG: glycosyltransferase family 87 protein [Beijerinckiaceae bacterium]|nr:glycosyltransferase family 87 protein [Beijerinckiaceae bacterium]
MEDQANYRRLALIGAIICAGSLGPYVLGLHGRLPFLLDAHGIQLGRDFINTWFYGQAFWSHDPGRFYDQDVYERALQAVFPANRFDHVWSYPPVFLVFAAPFGLFSYPVALAFWTLLGLGALFLTVHRKGWRWRTSTVLLSPAVLQAVVAGQISLFCATAILGIFRLMDRHPVRAGLVLSCLSVKPQMALLFPVLLIASRRWRVLVAAAAGVAGIVLVSVLLNGTQTWIDFVTKGLPAQAADMRVTMAALGQISVAPTSALLLTGVPASLATCVQVALSLLAAGLVAYAGYHAKTAGPEREALIFLSCSVFATPYLLAHDLVALTAGAVLFARGCDPARGKTWLVLLLYLPSIQLALGAWNVHVAFLIPIGFALWQTARLNAAVRRGVARDVGVPLALGVLGEAQFERKVPVNSL